MHENQRIAGSIYGFALGIATLITIYFFLAPFIQDNPVYSPLRFNNILKITAVWCVIFFIATASIIVVCGLKNNETANSESERHNDYRIQNLLGPIIFISGAACIGFLAYYIINMLSSNPTLNKEDLKLIVPNIFSTVVTVFSTWVGTVIAFYFGAENFKQAVAGTGKQIRDVVAETQPAKELVSARMIKFDDIKSSISVKDESELNNMEYAVIKKLFNAQTSRVIVFTNNGLPLRVFRSKRANNDANTDNTKVSDYLKLSGNDEDSKKFIASFASTKTVEEARQFISGQNANDIFITPGGNPNEKVIGWIPDDKLSRA